MFVITAEFVTIVHLCFIHRKVLFSVVQNKFWQFYLGPLCLPSSLGVDLHFLVSQSHCFCLSPTEQICLYHWLNNWGNGSDLQSRNSRLPVMLPVFTPLSIHPMISHCFCIIRGFFQTSATFTTKSLSTKDVYYYYYYSKFQYISYTALPYKFSFFIVSLWNDK